MTEFACDVAVCGGGIAGLWAMHLLRAAGYHPVLLETGKLGGRQTLAAQGILHGGMKYALDGRVDDIAVRLREMPKQWLDSMAGNGAVDLRGTQVLSESQFMWSDGSLLSKISGALGSKMLQGDVESLEKSQWPAAFHELQYKGSVRELKETIIDVKSAVTSLAIPLEGAAFQCESLRYEITAGNVSAIIINETMRLIPKIVVSTAGLGNEVAAEQLGLPSPATQRRPLRQMLIRGVPWKLYGHCIVADPKPRVTVTSHSLADGTGVWYLGGNVAEKACKLASEADSIAFAVAEMSAVFPKVDWKKFPWAVWDVDRAEPHQSLRFMPSEPTITEKENCLICWPTKLVFAPALASRIATQVKERIAPSESPAILPLPAAKVGEYPWEQANWKSA